MALTDPCACTRAFTCAMLALVPVLMLVLVLMLGDYGPLNFYLGLRTRTCNFVRGWSWAGGLKKYIFLVLG